MILSLVDVAAACRRLAEIYVRRAVDDQLPTLAELTLARRDLQSIGPLGGRLGRAIDLVLNEPLTADPSRFAAACDLITTAALHAARFSDAEETQSPNLRRRRNRSRPMADGQQRFPSMAEISSKPTAPTKAGRT